MLIGTIETIIQRIRKLIYGRADGMPILLSLRSYVADRQYHWYLYSDADSAEFLISMIILRITNEDT